VLRKDKKKFEKKERKKEILGHPRPILFQSLGLWAYCINIVVSPPGGPSIFPAYRGSTLVETKPSSLLPLVCIRLSHPWHLLLPRLGFFTKPQQQCLHFARVCSLCHHPSFPISGNVSLSIAALALSRFLSLYVFFSLICSPHQAVNSQSLHALRCVSKN